MMNDYVAQFKQGDYTGFDAFYREAKRPVYFTALGVLGDHHLAEDVMQDTFVTFLETIDRAREGENIFAYLSVIARNKALNHAKRASRVTHDDEAFATLAAPPEEDASGVEEILAHLTSDEEREIVIYHVLLDYKFKDIAVIMGKPLGTVLWRYNKAMKHLKEKLGGERK